LETVGDAHVENAVKKYGTGSMEFDGTGDYLKSPASEQIVMGTGDFTIEGWIYNAGDTHAGAFQISTINGGLVANQTNTLAVGMRKSPVEWQVYAKNTFTDSSGQSWSPDTWYHFAAVAASTSIKIYINGEQETSFSSSTYPSQNLDIHFLKSSSGLNIGRFGGKKF